MWFTRISIHNPVLATMVMLALVVLGLFSYQRLKVDQFPDIDLPTLAIQMDYPGASPAIVETEVTRKVEEAVNTVAGISQLYSRSYEGSSVVIIQFNLDVDGRRAADDVREKLSAIRPFFRDEVKEPRVLRFDPANRPIFSLAPTSPQPSRHAMENDTHPGQGPKKPPGKRARRGHRQPGGRPQARDQRLPAPAGHGSAGHHARASAGHPAR